MDAHSWKALRAYQLWQNAGMPQGHDLMFWLIAEREYEQHRLCVLSLGSCPFQETHPLCGGRCVAVCTAPVENCRNRADNFNNTAPVV